MNQSNLRISGLITLNQLFVVDCDDHCLRQVFFKNLWKWGIMSEKAIVLTG